MSPTSNSKSDNAVSPIEGWSLASLLDLGTLIRGVSYAKGEAATAPSKDRVALVRANNIAEGLVYTDLQYIPQHRVNQEQMLQVGDVIVAMSSGSKAVVGKAASLVTGWDGTFGAFCGVVRPRKVIDARFFGYYFRTHEYRTAISEASAGTNINNLKREHFAALQMPVPPLAEQKRIVGKVEELLGRVNSVRERLAKVPGILKRFRQAVLAAACCGQLTAERRAAVRASECAADLLGRIRHARAERERLGAVKARERAVVGDHTDLPELPDTWVWATWDQLADWITYGFTRPMPHVGHGIPIVTAKNVRDGYLDATELEYTTREAFAALSEKDKPKRGEILITKDGAIRGRAAVVDWDRPFCISQAVAVVRFGGISADPHYLLRVIQSPMVQHMIEEESSGTAIPHISITDFGRFPVPLPPLAEQREIVRRVEALFRLADAIEKRVGAATARADKLTQSILAKAFRGELVPTEAELARAEGREYEPAAVLLEKIREERGKTEDAKTRR